MKEKIRTFNNTIRCIFNYLRVYNKNISWKILRYRQYIIEVEIDEDNRTKFFVYRDTRSGLNKVTNRTFRSKKSAENYIQDLVERSTRFAIIRRKRFNRYVNNLPTRLYKNSKLNINND